MGAAAVDTSAPAEAAAPGETEDERLGLTPTPAEAIRLSDRAPGTTPPGRGGTAPRR